MARDISAGVDTAGRVRPEGFVRGVIDTRRDHDWYRVELDPGDYVIWLSGTGDRPVGDPLLVLRDEDGVETDRNDDYYTRSGESRVEIEVTGGRKTYYLDVSGIGPYTVPRGGRARPGARWAARPATSCWRSTGSTARRSTRSPAPSGSRSASSTSTSRRTAQTGEIFDGALTAVSGGWNGYQIRRAMAALDAYSDVCDVSFRQTHQRAQADLDLLLYGADGQPGRRLSSRPPGPSAKAPASSPRGPKAVADNNWAFRPGGGLEAGAPGWELMLHEFGHALGLAHPHDEGFGSVVMDGIRPPDRQGSHPFDAGRLRPELDPLHGDELPRRRRHRLPRGATTATPWDRWPSTSPSCRSTTAPPGRMAATTATSCPTATRSAPATSASGTPAARTRSAPAGPTATSPST